MKFRPAGVTDLITAKGKYHKKCLIAYKYLTGKSKKETQKTDIATDFICSELHYAAERNQILQLSDVLQTVSTKVMPLLMMTKCSQCLTMSHKRRFLVIDSCRGKT